MTSKNSIAGFERGLAASREVGPRLFNHPKLRLKRAQF
jgi:hypothetical protein